MSFIIVASRSNVNRYESVVSPGTTGITAMFLSIQAMAILVRRVVLSTLVGVPVPDHTLFSSRLFTQT